MPWFIEGRPGPIDSQTLRRLAAEGDIGPATLIRKETGAWKRADAVPGLAFAPPMPSVVSRATVFDVTAPVESPPGPLRHPKPANDAEPFKLLWWYVWLCNTVGVTLCLGMAALGLLLFLVGLPTGATLGTTETLVVFVFFPSLALGCRFQGDLVRLWLTIERNTRHKP